MLRVFGAGKHNYYVFFLPGSTICTCFCRRDQEFIRVLDAGKTVGILASLIISETEVEDLATVAAQETCDKGVEEGQTAVSFGPQSESRPSLDNCTDSCAGDPGFSPLCTGPWGLGPGLFDTVH